MSLRIGDVSRKRRFAANLAKRRWYAQHRSRRFALRFLGVTTSRPPPAKRLPAITAL
jgi:hypothetical protein